MNEIRYNVRVCFEGRRNVSRILDANEETSSKEEGPDEIRINNEKDVKSLNVPSILDEGALAGDVKVVQDISRAED